MLKITNLETSGWEAAIRGMRNPMNSWGKSDSQFNPAITLGPNDLDLACRLIKAGPEHCKFLRMIHVQMDIKAPLYWWKEMDTYKVSTTANSCSTMHKITAKEFALEDFSCEHLFNDESTGHLASHYMQSLKDTIDCLNCAREHYLETKDKQYWWQMIQLLPSSYNQLRTWDASMQTILYILHQRKGHKLDEWHTFRHICFEQIPYCKEFYTIMTGDDNYEIS